jgi:AdoMet-dependent heme synthase
MFYVKVMKSEKKNRYFWEIVPGTRCNLTCKNCYAADNARPDMRELDWKDMRVAVERSCDLGMKEIDVLGGEPLLYQPLDKFIKHFKYKVPDGYCGIVSNGVLMTRERAKSLREAGLDQVTISMDGTTAKINDANRGIGTYDKATKGIENALNEDISVTISYTVTPFNVKDAPNIFPFVKNIGARALGVQITEIVGRARRTLTEYDWFNRMEGLKTIVGMYTLRPTVYTEISTRNQFKGFLNHFFNADLEIPSVRCDGGVKTYMVSSGGDLFPCSQYAYSPSGKAMNKGVNLVTDDFNTLKTFVDKKYRKFNREMGRLEENNFSTCRGCTYRNTCAPCPLVNPKGVVPECEWVKFQTNKLNGIILNSDVELLLKPEVTGANRICFDVQTQKRPLTLLMSNDTFNKLVRLRKVATIIKFLQKDANGTTKTRDEVIEFLCKLQSHRIVRIEGFHL